MRNQKLTNIYRLGTKELWGMVRDPIMIVLILYVFTASIYIAATAVPEQVHLATLAIVDEDDSAVSKRIRGAFYPPRFTRPFLLHSMDEVDRGMDKGVYTFSLDIPPNFQRDVLAGRSPDIQLNVDATRMGQAFVGGGYIQQIALGEVQEFVQRYRGQTHLPADLDVRMSFNPNLTQSWFASVIEIINQITTMAIILTGAALIREREHGTIEHLLVMPVTPCEIMLSKVWSMGLVVLAASFVSLTLVVQTALHVPLAGSVALFMGGAALHLFATTSMGIFLATLARSMPQFGMLLILVLLPLQMLSGGSTPRESMPQAVQDIMQLAPTTHFIQIGQAILYRGAGMDTVWPSFLALTVIGAAFFLFALRRFRKTLSSMA